METLEGGAVSDERGTPVRLAILWGYRMVPSDKVTGIRLNLGRKSLQSCVVDFERRGDNFKSFQELDLNTRARIRP